jgi:N-acetylglutamate synthase-like GNAT family acetyltransferase
VARVLPKRRGPRTCRAVASWAFLLRRLGTTIQLVQHHPGAPGLRLGLGPGLRPVRAIEQLRQLFENNSFWALDRSLHGLRRMLHGSEAVVSAWQEGRLVGFGRATSDGCYRAVLWDVVVARDHEGQGLGRRLVEALLAAAPVAGAERVYLMTTTSRGFYERLGFEEVQSQRLMRLIRARS